MCKDNLGKCGCGCNKCGSSSTQKTTITTIEPKALVPSGFEKKSEIYAQTYDYNSGYSKKAEVPKATAPVPKKKERKPIIDKRIHTPEVEVLPGHEKKGTGLEVWGTLALGVGLVLVGAAVKNARR